MFSREQMQRAIEDALKTMEGVALELYRRGREEAREELETVKRERDEARTSCPDCAMWAERSARWHDDMQRAERERDEARAERDTAIARITEVGVMVATNGNLLAKDAYRRGAEAMRERCEELVKHNSHEDGIGMGSQRIESGIRALSIPEEP